MQCTQWSGARRARQIGELADGRPTADAARERVCSQLERRRAAGGARGAIQVVVARIDAANSVPRCRRELRVLERDRLRILEAMRHGRGKLAARLFGRVPVCVVRPVRSARRLIERPQRRLFRRPHAREDLGKHGARQQHHRRRCRMRFWTLGRAHADGGLR
eukprot:6425971-Prymnesium_polylepis.1